MQEKVAVRLSETEQHLVLTGGDQRGSDSLHRLVSGWPGWRRVHGKGQFEGRPASVYQARLWAHTAFPLLRSTMTVLWGRGAQQVVEAVCLGADRARVALESPPYPHTPPTARSQMLHQRQAMVALAELHYQALLTDDMGLGKTATALWAWHESRMTRLLVVCPKSVKLNWRAEVELCLGPPERVPCFVVDGTPAKRAEILAAIQKWMVTTVAQPGVAVVNYDALRTMSPEEQGVLSAWAQKQMVVLDESHYIKSMDAERTKLCISMFRHATARIAMSGTPIRNTVEDLYSQCEFVRPDSWCSRSDFINRYLVLVPTKFAGRARAVNVVRGSKNVQELNAVVNTMRIGRKKEEVLNLPPKIITKPMLELDGPTLDVYKSMKELAIIELSKLIEAASAAENASQAKLSDRPLTIFQPMARSAVEAAMRCEQIAQGFLSGIPEPYLEKLAPKLVKHAEKVEGYPGAVVFPAAPKIVWLMDAIEEITMADRQVVVFSRFNAPLMWLKKRYDSAACLLGSMDAIDRQKVIEGFQRKELRILLVQVKLAEGFNLTTASDVLFLGRDWSPAINAQAEARCHRIGSVGTVNVQVPIVQNTIERLIDRKLAAKDADAQQALRHVTIQELMEAL